MARRLTTYVYTNFDVAAKYRTAILWHDSDNDQVRYQCGATVTPWHGEMRALGSDGSDGIMVVFDARHKHNQKPNLKSAVMVRSAPETWEGHDCNGRNVRMYPIQRWVFHEMFNAWTVEAEWSLVHSEWIEVIPPPPLRPVPQ